MGGLSDDGRGDDEDIYLFFIPSGITGLTSWQFHPFDDDFFPSIPHGHNRKNDGIKLDPYLGWIYRGSRQTAREERRKIVALWNDDGFRRAALLAIDYYLNHHPTFTGWRVSNPRRLPRIRS
jgi:hypothetical protein